MTKPILPDSWRRTRRESVEGLRRWYGYEPNGLYRISIVKHPEKGLVAAVQVRVGERNWTPIPRFNGPLRTIVRAVEIQCKPLSTVQRATVRLLDWLGGEVTLGEVVQSSPKTGKKFQVRAPWGITFLYVATVESLQKWGLVERERDQLRLTVQGIARVRWEEEREAEESDG